MATAAVDSCGICVLFFNSNFFQSVSLPCNHNFCLLCLVRLRASGKNNCPTCRRNYAGFEVLALPGMEALAATMQTDQEDEGRDMNKKKGMFERCEKHSRPYEYWVNDIQEFYCAKCATEKPYIKLDLIEDVIPQIKEALDAEISRGEKKVQSDVESLDERNAELVRHRNTVRKFIKAVEALDDNFKREMEEIADTRLEALSTSEKLRNMKIKLESLSTFADIHVAVECKSILKGVAAPSSVPASDLPKTLLCNIAHSYVQEEAATANPPCKASFVDAVLKYPKTSPKTVVAAESLVGGVKWTVDNNNCMAALLALANRQPSVLTLVAKDDAREVLPVAAIARAANGCEVWARFVDTFYAADNSVTDAERLGHLTANQSLRLTRFFGHLNQSAIAKLPHTIAWLGLAIGNATDAAAVSGLRPWEGLILLSVSVSSRVAAKDLKPLPSVAHKQLFFPFLSDAGVDSVRPAIEALAPDLRISCLCFPKSQLTAAGARQLAQRLRGVTITYCVSIEASGSWRPGAEEKKSVKDELRSLTGCCGVKWDMDFMYA